MGNCAGQPREVYLGTSIGQTDPEFVPTFLTGEEMNLIITTWPLAHQQHPDLCAFVLLQILRRSAQIRQTLDMAQEDLLTDAIHLRIIGQANAMEDFINDLLFDLRSDRVAQMCTELGAKHVAYRKSGFQPVFWDIFTASMTDVFKSVEVNELATRQNDADHKIKKKAD